MNERVRSRRLQVLAFLKTRELISAKELAERFDVNIRTIYRDMEELLQAGLPLEGTPGVDGGYRFRSDADWERIVEDYERNTFSAPSVSSSVPMATDPDDVRSQLSTSHFNLEDCLALQKRGMFYFELSNGRTHCGLSKILNDIRSALIKRYALAITRFSEMTTSQVVGQEEVVVPLGIVWSENLLYMVVLTLQGTIVEVPLSAIAFLRIVGLSFEPPEGFELSSWWNNREKHIK